MSGDLQIAGDGDTGEPSPLAAILDDHAAHLLDYCTDLIGDEATAAHVADAALTAARAVLLDPDKLRAWLFALARSDALSKGRLEAGTYGDAPDEDPDSTARWAFGQDDGVGSSLDGDRTFGADGYLTGTAATEPAWAGAKREVLDLVYRHGIPPDHLPTVLGMPPESVDELLKAAEAEDYATAAYADSPAAFDGAPVYADRDLDETSPKPLFLRPTSVRANWIDAARGDELGPDHGMDMDRPRRRARRARRAPGLGRARRRSRTLAAALLPAAAAVAAIVYLAAPHQPPGSTLPQASRSHDPRTSAKTSSSAGSALPLGRPKSGPHVSPSHRAFADPAPTSARPRPQPTKKSPHPSPSPTKPHPSRSPKPSPSPSSPTPSPTSSPTPTGTPTS